MEHGLEAPLVEMPGNYVEAQEPVLSSCSPHTQLGKSWASAKSEMQLFLCLFPWLGPALSIYDCLLLLNKKVTKDVQKYRDSGKNYPPPRAHYYMELLTVNHSSPKKEQNKYLGG